MADKFREQSSGPESPDRCFDSVLVMNLLTYTASLELAAISCDENSDVAIPLAGSDWLKFAARRLKSIVSTVLL